MSIKIEDVSFVYNKGTNIENTVLKNINLEIKDGEFIGLIGHTGSGKSTLIQMLNALIKPTSGKITIDDLEIKKDKKTLSEIRKKVGLVFQYPEHQLFELNVYKDVAFGPKNIGMSEEEIDISVKKSLELVGLDETFYNKPPFNLSGGQKRKVAIASVLAMNPKVLILDEPTAGLDPKASKDILNKIKEMHEMLDITIILVSHSMEMVAKLCDKILVLNKGEKVYFDTPKEVFKNSKNLEKIGLKVPQTTILMNALVEKGYNVPLSVFTVEEATEVLYKLIKEDD